MTNKLSVRTALERAARLQNPDITHQAEEAAKLLTALADAATAANVTPAAWSADDILKAAATKKPLLTKSVPEVTAEQFAAVGTALTRAYLDAVKPADDIARAVAAIDWKAVTTNKDIRSGLAEPEKFIETLVEKMDERIEPVAVLLSALSVRAVLESSSARASALFEEKQRDTVHFDRPTQCPVCGAPAVIASVGGTHSHGNVKTLYCTTCGAHWPFERIRCAACGDEAVSDLEYVHDEKDDTRRLHVCKHCAAAFPTVFVTDAEQFDPDIDGIAIAGLMEWFEEHREEKTQA